MEVIYGVAKDAFKEFVDAQIEDRNKNVVHKNDVGIKVNPEILKVLRESTHVSSKLQQTG